MAAVIEGLIVIVQAGQYLVLTNLDRPIGKFTVIKPR